MILKFKNLFLTLILIITTFLFTSCYTDSTTIKLPDLTGMTREEITEVLESKNISFSFKFDYTSVKESELDQFIKYNKYEIGEIIDKTEHVYVYTTLLPLDFDYTSEVKFDLDYKDKSFVEDGIGQVRLARTIDGDTAHFYDINGDYIKVRFLGINTPESTYEKDPWGKAASNYTSNILRNAEVIVLESEGSRMDTYGRYLAYVWVDGILLNLQIVQEAYSHSTLTSSDKYFDIFIKASQQAQKTGRRFYGEIDPDYNY